MPRLPLPTLLRIALAFAIAFGTFSVAKGDYNLRGTPYNRFYTSKDFGSGATSEFITIAPNGTLFYSDRNWILQFDGAVWHKVYNNSDTVDKITALHWDDGHIYAAGYNTIGELVLDENNKAVFKHLIPRDTLGLTQSFQSICSTEDGLFITGKRAFAYYHKSDGSHFAHEFDTWLTASFWYNNTFHILLDSNEVVRFEDGALTQPEPLDPSGRFGNVTIADAITLENGTVIMASERRGIFSYDGNTLDRAYPNYSYNHDNLVRDIEISPDGHLLVASLGGGIESLDHEGNLVEHLNPNFDHRFKSARALAIDPSGTLWGMFNASIAKTLLAKPLTQIDENLRPSLFFGSQHLSQGKLYLRNFYLLYESIYDESNRLAGFRNALPEHDLEVWAVTNSDLGLYLSTRSGGIFEFVNGDLISAVDAPPLDRLNRLKTDPRYLLGANSRAIYLYRKNDDSSLSEVDSISNPNGFINRMYEDAQGDFWLEFGLGKVGQLKVSDEKLTLTVYGSEHGLPANEWLTIWMHSGEALFTCNAGTFVLDPTKDTFVLHPILQSPGIDEGLNIQRAFTDPQGNLWISANDQNLIFWLQEDGSYRRDEVSLSEMGEPYFEFLSFLESGEVLIMTAFEFFHYRPDAGLQINPQEPPPTRLLNIASSNQDQVYFQQLGNQEEPSSLIFKYSQNSLSFTVANPFSHSTGPTQFQHHLSGFDVSKIQGQEDSWSLSSTATFTNLDEGNYTYRARAKFGNGYVTPWVSYSFSVSPPLHRSPLAYIAYFILAAVVVFGVVKFFSSRLKRQNQKLESMVHERTKEIEAKNRELEQKSKELQLNTEELGATLDELRQTQNKLLTTARVAGRAEVATNVLHSVGNVLNSINIGLSKLEQRITHSLALRLRTASDLLQREKDSLASFLTENEKGKQFPLYLEKLAASVESEQQEVLEEIHHLDRNIGHIKSIVATQQEHAKRFGVTEQTSLREVAEAALAITLGDVKSTAYTIQLEIPPSLTITTDRIKLMDILINLIKNAKDALDQSKTEKPTLRFSVNLADKAVVELSLSDNGSGIEKKDLERLFSHGFTTKAEGHGFGLHSCALAMKELGGNLSLKSDGPNLGTTAILKLPRR